MLRAYVLKLIILINYTVPQSLRSTRFGTSQCKNKERVKKKENEFRS